MNFEGAAPIAFDDADFTLSEGAESPLTGQEWFTAAELAELALPGLPGDKRSLNRRARLENWALRCAADGSPLSRPRLGRGGGTEFHLSLLPAQARIELARRGIVAAVPSTGSGQSEVVSSGSWRWFEGQTEKIRAEAARRAAVVGDIDLLEGAGLTRTAAIAEAARRHGVSTATLWNWLRLVEGVAPSDRLPALAPRFQGGGKEAEIDPFIWNLFKSDYLRQSAPTLAICYAKCIEVAKERGVAMPSEASFRRRVKREIDPQVLLLARKGTEALRRSLPAQRRSVAELHALEVVNMDGHKFDVRVTPPDGGDPIRPIMIGIQDVYSRKLLAWRIGTSETAWLTRLVFADLFSRFGIPRRVHLDNGRAFASKWITGGKKVGRFRFKINDTDPTGLLTALNVETTFTLPYRGQSKPIERAWKDLCDSISRSAAFEGAYTGNNTVNKPENYGSREVPWAEFVAEVERGIAFHNARPGRRTETAKGRSFDDAFNESYASTAQIGKAAPEHMRMALLMGENVKVNRDTGEIALFGNRYYTPGWSHLNGQLVTVRFDPDDLHAPLHLYDLKGRYLTAFDVYHDVGFNTVEGSKTAARLVSDVRKQTRALLEAERRLSAAEVARIQRGVDAPEPALPEPAVLRPVRPNHRNGGGQTAAALKPAAPAQPTHESNVFAALGKLRVVE